MSIYSSVAKCFFLNEHKVAKFVSELVVYIKKTDIFTYADHRSTQSFTGLINYALLAGAGLWKPTTLQLWARIVVCIVN